MTEPTVPGPEPSDAGPRARRGAFRWQAFFRRAADAVFVLDGWMRVAFVNEAWESLTGVPASEARRFVCRRPRPVGPDGPVQTVLEHAMTPPREARRGATACVRRLLPGRDATRRWWDVEFFPLLPHGLRPGVLMLGRIRPVPTEDAPASAPLPERLVALRERTARRYGPGLLAGESPAMRLLAEQARLAARTDAPVLLVGEAGAGKETLARHIHYAGPNHEQPFAALDCARLPAAALAEVLFGPPRAYLGALYLREPSRLPRDMQQRLCESLRCEETGGRGPRVIAGCDADPAVEVQAGRLLDELHAALAVLTLRLPPLRERLADLPSLVDRLLERCNEEGEPKVQPLGPDAWDILRAHRWPGNLREAYAVLSAARRHASGERVTAADLPASLRLLRAMEETPGRRPERPLPLDALLEQAERKLIEMALRRAGGKLYRAAEILSIYRTRLARRMKALGIAGPEGDDTE